MRSVRFLGCLLFFPGILWSLELGVPLETRHILGPGRPGGSPPVELHDDFYLLGWGPQERLAYLIRQEQEPGQFTIQLSVQDIIDDGILLTKTWPAWKTDEERASWWTTHQTEIETCLAPFEVLANEDQLGLFPMVYQEDFFRLALRQGHVPQSAWIQRLSLILQSSERGLKTVQDRTGLWRWATVAGFLPSPRTDRIAIVLVVQPVGWRGSQQSLRFLVTGASLVYGFSKP